DSRQWLRDGTPIAGATAVTYVPTAADLDRTLSVRFSGSKAGHDSATATSAGVTVRVGDAPSVLTRPSLSGTAKVGGTLHVATPTWSLTGVVTAVQWLRDGTPIAGATGFSYTPGAADLGRTVSARVRGTRAGHAEGTAESAGL